MCALAVIAGVTMLANYNSAKADEALAPWGNPPHLPAVLICDFKDASPGAFVVLTNELPGGPDDKYMYKITDGTVLGTLWVGHGTECMWSSPGQALP